MFARIRGEVMGREKIGKGAGLFVCFDVMFEGKQGNEPENARYVPCYYSVCKRR